MSDIPDLKFIQYDTEPRLVLANMSAVHRIGSRLERELKKFCEPLLGGKLSARNVSIFNSQLTGKLTELVDTAQIYLENKLWCFRSDHYLRRVMGE